MIGYFSYILDDSSLKLKYGLFHCISKIDSLKYEVFSFFEVIKKEINDQQGVIIPDSSMTDDSNLFTLWEDEFQLKTYQNIICNISDPEWFSKNESEINNLRNFF